MDNIELGMQVQRRLNWPTSEYEEKDIHPPAEKKGKIIAYTDIYSVKHG